MLASPMSHCGATGMKTKMQRVRIGARRADPMAAFDRVMDAALRDIDARERDLRPVEPVVITVPPAYEVKTEIRP
jgi:hypothetical protein